MSVGGVDSFPKGFLWGTATAAHQVEGDNRNSDWWRFEQEPGHIFEGQTSGIACDHYHRYHADFDLLREMHNNAHRLSIEWSRIEPSAGEFDRRQLRHYRDVISDLREKGMEPMVTLHHFTSPIWFADRGGWASAGAPDAFMPFVQRAAEELGDLVDLWCTFNEPNIYAVHGWLYGQFPPGRRRDVKGAYQVLANMRLAHLRAYEEIKRLHPQSQVGVTHHTVHFMRGSGLPWDRLAFRGARLYADYWPESPRKWHPILSESGDFLGVQHYYGQVVRFDLRRPRDLFVRLDNVPGAAVTDFGFSADARWMEAVLVDLSRYGKPIYVTENGISARDDSFRQEYLRNILRGVAAAIRRGADVRGYFHWTSLDNFEWARGYKEQFGLIAVDRQTLERTPKPSAGVYSRIAQANAVVD